MTYEEFITSIRESRPLNEWFKYSERHHIVPHCIGGTNDEGNLIYLTYKEHFIAHKLLAIENPSNKKLLYAYWRMCNNKKVATSEEYESARLLFIEAISGENHPFFNHHHTDEHKQHLSICNPMYSKEFRDKASKAHLGTSLSKEHRAKISANSPWNDAKRSEILREFHSKKMKEIRAMIDQTGVNNPMYGKHGKDNPNYMRKYKVTCKVCGKSFLGSNPNSRYCDNCKL